MTAIISRRYAFSERVFDATEAEHDKALGLSEVRVVEADALTETIMVHPFDRAEIARMWVAVEESDPDNTATFYIVGADV